MKIICSPDWPNQQMLVEKTGKFQVCIRNAGNAEPAGDDKLSEPRRRLTRGVLSSIKFPSGAKPRCTSLEVRSHDSFIAGSPDGGEPDPRPARPDGGCPGRTGGRHEGGQQEGRRLRL